MDFDFKEIRFGCDNPKLQTYRKYYWNPQETRVVEFYPNIFVPVTLLYSSDPALLEKLLDLNDGKPISIDLEWAQDYVKSPNVIELFQFASSKGVILVASHNNTGYDKIATFLHSAPFFGKGMSYDKKKLKQVCGEDFNMEDIEITRLAPNNLSLNFESISLEFIGQSMAKFKDHRVQRSDWSARPLTILQILYGAHDAYAMLLVYEKIKEKFGDQIIPIQKKEKPKKQRKSGLNKGNMPECHFISDIISIADIHIQQQQQTEICGYVEEIPITIKDQLINHEKNCGKFATDDDSCFVENANDILRFVLATKPDDVKLQLIKYFYLMSDLLLLGIVKNMKDGKFLCLPCFKRLSDTTGLFQHSQKRHSSDQLPEIPLNVIHLLLHFLTATEKVNCPYNIVNDVSKLKRTDFEKEDNDEECEEEEEDSKEEFPKIAPILYNENEGIVCRICHNKKFDSVESLQTHCWIEHYTEFVDLFEKKGDIKKNVRQIENDAGLFCINKLRLAAVTHDPQIIHCQICSFTTQQPSNFFLHIFFAHPKFAFVSRKDYAEWPLKFCRFTDAMMKQTQNITIPTIELVKNNVYDETDKKCVDCDVTFIDDSERNKHYLENHLIFFPL